MRIPVTVAPASVLFALLMLSGCIGTGPPGALSTRSLPLVVGPAPIPEWLVGQWESNFLSYEHNYTNTPEITQRVIAIEPDGRWTRLRNGRPDGHGTCTAKLLADGTILLVFEDERKRGFAVPELRRRRVTWIDRVEADNQGTQQWRGRRRVL